jgi:hypothetical protein
VAFLLHLLERVAVKAEGPLENGRHGAERLTAGGTESPRWKRGSRTAPLASCAMLDTGFSA